MNKKLTFIDIFFSLVNLISLLNPPYQGDLKRKKEIFDLTFDF